MHRIRFAHLSDPHLPITTKPGIVELVSKRVLGWSNWQRNRRHHHKSEILKAIVDDIHQQTPDLTLLTGDVANIALESEFQQAVSWVKTLGSPENVLFVPGNHDTYVSMPWGESLGYLSAYMTGYRHGDIEIRPAKHYDDFPYCRDIGPFRFIGLNSSPSTLPGLATGALGDEQRQRLQALLAQSDKQYMFNIIMLHHPAVKGVVKRRKALDDIQAALPILAGGAQSAGAQAHLVVHGHAHYPYFTQIEGANNTIPHIGVASASYAGKGETPDVKGYRPAAQYHLYTAERTDTGFALSLEVRGVDLDTSKVASIRQLQLI